MSFTRFFHYNVPKASGNGRPEANKWRKLITTNECLDEEINCAMKFDRNNEWHTFSFHSLIIEIKEQNELFTCLFVWKWERKLSWLPKEVPMVDVFEDIFERISQTELVAVHWLLFGEKMTTVIFRVSFSSLYTSIFARATAATTTSRVVKWSYWIKENMQENKDVCIDLLIDEFVAILTM